jgi:hypothetical protein
MDHRGAVPIEAGPADASVDRWLTAHHGCAVLLVEAMGVDAADQSRMVEDAWLDTASALAASPGRPLRASLLGAVVRRLPVAGNLGGDTAEFEELAAGHFFCPPDDRWAGWWNISVPLWPADWSAGRDQVLNALRRLPKSQRLLLVLRDAARLPANEVTEMVGLVPEAQAPLLDVARQAYVQYLDEEFQADIERMPTDRRQKDGGGR